MKDAKKRLADSERRKKDADERFDKLARESDEYIAKATKATKGAAVDKKLEMNKFRRNEGESARQSGAAAKEFAEKSRGRSGVNGKRALAGAAGLALGGALAYGAAKGAQAIKKHGPGVARAIGKKVRDAAQRGRAAVQRFGSRARPRTKVGVRRSR